MTTALTIRKRELSVEMSGKALETVKSVLANPLLSGLGALALNQAFYRMGLYDPRPSADGRYYTWKRTWGFSKEGLNLGSAVWAQGDPEEIAASNATIIGTALLGAMIAYAAAPKSVSLAGGG